MTEMPTFLDKKCRWWGFGRFPYLWEISPLRMFWQPSHLSCTFLLKTFGANTNSLDFRCQIKILQDFFLHNLELFMPGNHVQGGKDKCFVKTTFLFPFFASFMLQESLLMTARRQIYFSWLFKLCSVPPTFVSFPFSFGQILFIFPRSHFILFSPFVREDFLWVRQK